MIIIKIKLFILLLFISFSLPFGGIGISGIQNIINTSGAEAESNGGFDLALDFESNGAESGFSPFIYFDALPYDLAIQYNREYRFTPLNSTTLVLTNTALGSSETTEFESVIVRVSDYFTIRKEMMSVSIPILAKAALHLGGGFNSHRTVKPSISLLKDIYNFDELDAIYAESGALDSSELIDVLENNMIKSNGIHIQAGLQGKILMTNIFINAKYTLILNDDDNSIQSFPGLDIGLAFGI